MSLGNTMAEPNPYRPPEAEIQVEARRARRLRLAGRGVRLGAVLLNSLISSAALLPLISVALLVDPSDGGTDVVVAVCAVISCCLFLALVVGNLVFLYKNGQTLGKKLVGIRIVRPDGGRASLSRILLVRELLPVFLGYVPVLGIFFWLADTLAIFGDSRRCLHDHMADTIVVEA